jgi:hypothetical protein
MSFDISDVLGLRRGYVHHGTKLEVLGLGGTDGADKRRGCEKDGDRFRHDRFSFDARRRVTPASDRALRSKNAHRAVAFQSPRNWLVHKNEEPAGRDHPRRRPSPSVVSMRGHDRLNEL